MTLPKLKPCPFCGHKVDPRGHGESEEGHFLYCQTCGAMGPDWLVVADASVGPSTAERIRGWNQRPEHGKPLREKGD